MSNNRWLMLIFFLLLCYGGAGIGSIWTSFSVSTWYADLKKPSFNPPNWIFAPVWSALYFLMATSAWLVWRRAGWSGARFALALFFGQLALNVAWSGLFFALHRPGMALIEIVLLLGTIAATAVTFRPVSRLAFWLMVPYALWVAFAALLNFKIWRLNLGAA
ncbi:MAG TPA: TspO/MBR family protein [Terriglobales bacterium]|nr:TspO/MBR family protein [Terriglobales bacterium]